MQDRPRRTARRNDRRLVLAVALTALAVLVLRAPMDVLTVLAPTTLATSSDTSADTTPPGSDESDIAGVGSVRARDAGGVASGEEGDAVVRAPDDVTQGRFGTPVSRPTTALVIEELRGGWRVESGVEEAAALAVISGHTWAATSGAFPAAPGGSPGAIVTVEAVERPGAHHAVVTLLIAAAGGGAPQLHRIVVPVLLDVDGPTIAGAPWVLPAPKLRTSELEGSAIGDIELIAAARAALDGVGIPGERMVALEVTEGWPFIARLDDDTQGHPWLRWHVDRFVVAGLPLDAGRGRTKEDDWGMGGR
jgi:hypothetical protein